MNVYGLSDTLSQMSPWWWGEGLERVAFDVGIMISSPVLGGELTFFFF